MTNSTIITLEIDKLKKSVKRNTGEIDDIKDKISDVSKNISQTVYNEVKHIKIGGGGSGGGDMSKATYDTNNNGKVDISESAETLTGSQATDITNNTTARHTHSNQTTLDKFGEDSSGLPTYNGNNIDTTISQRDVYDGLDSTDNTISLSAKQGKVLDDKINATISANGSINTHSDVNTAGAIDMEVLSYDAMTGK